MTIEELKRMGYQAYQVSETSELKPDILHHIGVWYVALPNQQMSPLTYGASNEELAWYNAVYSWHCREAGKETERQLRGNTMSDNTHRKWRGYEIKDEGIVITESSTRSTKIIPFNLEAIRQAYNLTESDFRAALVEWLMAHSDYAGSETK